MNGQILGDLSTTDLGRRLMRLERHVLNGNTPGEITVAEDVLGQVELDVDAEDIDTLEELTVTDLFKTPVYASTEDVPDLETGHIVTIEGDGLYVATGD